MSWNKPLPRPTAISAPFWDGLKAHEVRLQQCDQGHWLFFPRTHCPTCGSRQLAWKTVSGEGTLYTYTVARVPTLPEFSDEMPQLLAVVELQEGVHINTTMVGVKPEDLRVGQRVRPVFDERPGSATLLRFTPVESAQANVIPADKPAEEPKVAPAAAAETPKRQVSSKDIDAMRSLVSDAFSDWSNQIEVTQELINQFAELSGDDYWIHTDPVKAKAESPFGTTIAHGALVQVLVSRLKMPMDFEVTDFRNIVNYGSDRLRFATPVPAGCRIHGRYRIKSVEQVKSGVQVTMEINIHGVGQDRPSVINDLVMLYM
ncbi:bifunctional OB-fold nucleic acid binding domain-containing protein/MaoC family dehydratase [Polaromonas glacialis]|uniref:bifunctional OB-fold nucleic acid binding domain-containing protein/MaoC family dehydratase n=1 Tax=Polaromonas glacialis TaxID=866564 RepID=UPI000495FF0E|nr:OB-fold domain-containing protein [Polaromonas glacialis]